METNKKNVVRLTESQLKHIIENSVKNILKESNFSQDEEYYKWIREEKEMCKRLSDFLAKNGIKTVHVTEYQSGLPVVAMSTNEYYNSDVDTIANRF